MSAECTCVECGDAFDGRECEDNLCPSCVPDDHGNTEREPNKFCSFPDCGCDGARLCQAENGASQSAMWLNIERGSDAAKAFEVKS